MPSTEYVGKEPLTVQHLKIKKTTITAVKVAAEMEGRQMGWMYRDILDKWAEQFVEKLAKEKAKRAAAKRNGGK